MCSLGSNVVGEWIGNVMGRGHIEFPNEVVRRDLKKKSSQSCGYVRKNILAERRLRGSTGIYAAMAKRPVELKQDEELIRGQII